MESLFRTVLCLTICAAVPALPDSACAFSIAALGSIDMKGNNIESDSFDSSDIYNGIWNINGSYTNTLRKAGGHIISFSAITNSILNVGNAKIGGKVIIGPSGYVTIGAQGSVGDIPWITDPVNSGEIKPGWSNSALFGVVQDTTLPQGNWIIAAGAGTGGSGTVNGKSYDHLFNYSGDYAVADSGTIYVGTNVTVRLNITASTFSPDYIDVAGTGMSAGRMIAYLNGPPGQAMVLGGEHQTQGGKAAGLQFFGLPNCTSILYKGNGNFTGVIYAPQADFQLASTGGGYIDFIGFSITKTVQVNGRYHFHYDEDLRSRAGPIDGITTSLQGRPAVGGQEVRLFSPRSFGGSHSIPFEQPRYQWRFNGTNIPNATNSSLILTNVQPSEAGPYSVVITDSTGTFAIPPYVLQVYASAAPTLGRPVLSSSNQFQFSVAGVPGYSYIVESSTDLVNWDRLKTNTSPFTFSVTNVDLFPQRFFRAVRPPSLP